MSDEIFHDGGVSFCPNCSATTGNLTFKIIPDGSRLSWTDEAGEEHVHHLPEMRDYTCKNCDATWLMPDDALEDWP